MTGRKLVDGTRKRQTLALVVSGALLAGSVALLQSGSLAAAPTPDGGAYGAYGSISLFGGPPNVYNPNPSVTLPPGGTATAPFLSVIFGPAVFIRSGPATVSSNRVPGSVTSSATVGPIAGTSNNPCLFSYPADFTAGSAIVTSATANFTPLDAGRVVSNANLPVDSFGDQKTTILTVVSPTQVILAKPAATSATGSFLSIDRGPGSCIYFSQFTADTASSTCTASPSGITASTSFTNGQLITLTDNHQYPTVVQNIPDNPPPNLTIDGRFYLNGAPESFTYVFNEQVTDPITGALTVYAAHLIAKSPGDALGDVYLGASTCAPFVEVPTTTSTTSTTSTTIPPTTSTTSTTIPSDTTPPTCFVSAVRAGPPKQMDVTVQDTGSGLAAITGIVITNGTVSVAPFTPGTTAPVVVTATKTVQTSKTKWSFDAKDVAGNIKHCHTYKY